MISEKVRSVMIAIQSQWPNAKLDFTDPAGVWSNAIDPLRVDQIQHGVKMFRHVEGDFPMTPAQFMKLAQTYDAPEPKQLPQPDPTDRDLARQATNSAYAMLCCGMKVNTRKYTGPFDVDAFVATQEIPPMDCYKDEPWWQAMWRNFNTAYAASVGQN